MKHQYNFDCKTIKNQNSNSIKFEKENPCANYSITNSSTIYKNLNCSQNNYCAKSVEDLLNQLYIKIF